MQHHGKQAVSLACRNIGKVKPSALLARLSAMRPRKGAASSYAKRWPVFRSWAIGCPTAQMKRSLTSSGTASSGLQPQPDPNTFKPGLSQNPSFWPSVPLRPLLLMRMGERRGLASDLDATPVRQAEIPVGVSLHPVEPPNSYVRCS